MSSKRRFPENVDETPTFESMFEDCSMFGDELSQLGIIHPIDRQVTKDGHIYKTNTEK